MTNPASGLHSRTAARADVLRLGEAARGRPVDHLLRIDDAARDRLLDHRRPHGTREEGVDAHTAAGPLDAQHPRQTDDGRLARTVRGAAGHPDLRRR